VSAGKEAMVGELNPASGLHLAREKTEGGGSGGGISFNSEKKKLGEGGMMATEKALTSQPCNIFHTPKCFTVQNFCTALGRSRSFTHGLEKPLANTSEHTVCLQKGKMGKVLPPKWGCW